MNQNSDRKGGLSTQSHGIVSGGVSLLGLTTPDTTYTKFTHFITLCFPTNHRYKIKHLEYGTKCRIVFSDIKFGDCTQDEQYKWMLWILSRHISTIAETYDIFFEQTKEGNIHLHGRINSNLSVKNIKQLLHRMFETPTKYKPFCMIIKYDHTKWHDYQNKKEFKEYQKTEYNNFSNI